MGLRRQRRAGAAAWVAPRIVAFIVLIATPLALLAGCGNGAGSRPRPSTPRPGAGRGLSPGPLPPSPGPGTGTAGQGQAAVWAKAARITASMTLPEKAGQLLVATVPGTRATDGGADLVRRYHLGAVVYFAGNIRSPAQTASLSNGLQAAAVATAPGLPLLIGTDQEGGLVGRLDGLATRFPGQMAAGAARDPAQTRAAGQATGQQLRALGINLDYAPVADVNVDPANPVIGTRSFGSDPGLVSQMTAAAVAGLQSAGVAATAKHFPGHGDTDVDSHTGLPVIHHTLRQWWRIDAPPFRAAIRAGVDNIMIAHIVVPALDPSGRPASLSPGIVTGYLRDRLGYRGVITTDSLRMAGVRQGHTNAQVAVMAIQAGCDQLLMPADLATAYHAVIAAVRDGQITRAALDTSVTRVIALKLSRGLLAGPLVSAAAASLSMHTPAARAVARHLASRSVTLVRNRLTGGRPVLPLTGQAVYLAGPAAPALAPALQAALARAGGRLATSPAGATVLVAATQDAVGDPAQRGLLASLAATGKPLVVVATGLPYDLGLAGRAAGAMAIYSGTGVSMAAAAAVLTGQTRASGRLPVSIPGPDGRILYRYGAGLP